MATIVTKYSDYIVHSIEYFLSQIKTELAYRDIKGLTNGKIEIINPTKQHPLVQFMATQLSSNRNTEDLRSSLLPAISVTPGNMTDEGFTLGESFLPRVVDDEFINLLKTYLNMTNKEVQDELLITPDQIDSIIASYNRVGANGMRVQINEWQKTEEVHVSVWSESADIDILLGNLMDSILANMRVGFVGDESKLRNFKYTVSKGLTNFNFGKVLFGSEYGLTFLNTFRHFIIYTDPVLSGHDPDFTLEIPGE
jgi:hypothetical protein